jgi:hypothetical protein
MTLLERIDAYIMCMSPEHKERRGGKLLIEARGEIYRLTTENEELKIDNDNLEHETLRPHD